MLHRFFVRGPQSLAMSFVLDNTPAAIRFQARWSQIALECLAELFSSKDYKAKVQAAAFAASGYTLMNLPQMALHYIQKSCSFIKMGNLRFVPTYGRPPEFSEDLHETLVALSQTVYWANYLFLMCGGPEPHATAEVEKEFRWELTVGVFASPLRAELNNYLLQQTYPILFEICPLTMRTQGILLVRDAILLLRVLPVDGELHLHLSPPTETQLDCSRHQT